jgi:hypothetical protein
MNYTPAQILTTAIVIVIFAGMAFSQHRMYFEVALVLLLWGVLIAQVWRGPLQPPLLAFLRSDTSGWHGSRYHVKLPADYIRLGEPIPESAITTWKVVHILLFIGCVVSSILLLTGGILAWQARLLTR